MTLFYLSFADPDKPKGKQFLGATVVEAHHVTMAVSMAWLLGINPGGEVAIVELDQATVDDLPENARKYVNHLVPREDVMAEPHSWIFGDE